MRAGKRREIAAREFSGEGKVENSSRPAAGGGAKTGTYTRQAFNSSVTPSVGRGVENQRNVFIMSMHVGCNKQYLFKNYFIHKSN